MRDRDDNSAKAEAQMLQTTLENANGQMDPALRAEFLGKLLSAQGQLKSAADRAEADKRINGGSIKGK